MNPIGITPWKIGWTNGANIVVIDRYGVPMVDVPAGIDNDQSRALRLVHCVNAHDELLAACKTSLSSIQAINTYRYRGGLPLCEALQSAIAKAEGRE